MATYRIKRYSLLDKLARREQFYHGTSKEAAEKIKKEGLKAFPAKEEDLKESFPHGDEYGHPIDNKIKNKFSGKIYLHKDPYYSQFYADERGNGNGEILKISVPYKVHRTWKRGVNPERNITGVNHLKTNDDFAREHLGKPFRELSREDKERIKHAKKYADSETVIDIPRIPSKYIKGSKDYKKPTFKEIYDANFKTFSEKNNQSISYN